MSGVRKFDLSSSSLHVLAMALMLCDHMWATVIPGNEWLTCIGRLAFPIFAFLLVEGYFHTRDRKRYALRLLVAAVISEIPFNLMLGSTVFFPIHQNVIWTFLIGFGMMHLNELAKAKAVGVRVLVAVGTCLLGLVAGFAAMVDYYGAGVLMVLAFYFFRGRKWWHYLGQFAALFYLNVEMLTGLGYELSLFGESFFLPQQAFALLALIPIGLYRGRKGLSGRVFQYLCYGFYPAHMLLLWAVRNFLIG